jgi:hypothetical protein
MFLERTKKEWITVADLLKKHGDIPPERKRTVRLYTARDQFRLLTEDQSLDGGDVLPGLNLSLREVFAQLEEESARKKRKKR